MEINQPPTTPNERAAFRARVAADLLWLVVGTLILGLVFGDVGILIGLLGVGLVDALVKSAVQQ